MAGSPRWRRTSLALLLAGVAACGRGEDAQPVADPAPADAAVRDSSLPAPAFGDTIMLRDTIRPD